MWRILLTNQLQSVGRKLALLIFSWNKWLIESKTSLCFPEDYKGVEEETIHQSQFGSKASKHTGLFSEIRPTPGLLKRPKVEISWDFLLTLESLRRTMEKRQFAQQPQNPLGLRPPPRTEWPHVGLALAVYSLLLRDCACASATITINYRLQGPISEDCHSAGPQGSGRLPATRGNHRHSKLSPCTQSLQSPSHTQLSLCPEIPVVPTQEEEKAGQVGYKVKGA